VPEKCVRKAKKGIIVEDRHEPSETSARCWRRASKLLGSAPCLRCAHARERLDVKKKNSTTTTSEEEKIGQRKGKYLAQRINGLISKARVSPK